MQRDMDVIRQIILAAAADTQGSLSGISGMSPQNFAIHAQWLEEAGLVQAAIGPTQSKRPAERAIIFRLTWAGCDFADAIRSDTLWAKAKEKVIGPTASWTFGSLLDWLRSEIGNQLTNLTA